jgi:hypothetical protein
MVRRICELGGAATFVLLGACSSSGGGGARPTDGGGGASATSPHEVSAAGSDASAGVDGTLPSNAADGGAGPDVSRGGTVEGGGKDGDEGATADSGAFDASVMDSGAVLAADCDAGAAASTLSTGLVSWWRAEGNAHDSVGTNDGVAGNGVTYVARAGGQAFAFDGIMADVQIQTSTTLDVTDGYTLAFWINIPSLPTQLTHIIEKLVSYAEDKAVDLNPDGTLGFHIFPVLHMESPLNSTTALSVKAWHHVAATYDGSHADLYLDGRLDSSVAVSGKIDNSTGALGFAHNATRDAGYLAGDLDEIRWYARALSASEVTALSSGCN